MSTSLPTSLDELKKPIQKELDNFERKFREAMKSKVPLLDKITHYIIKRKGKQLRPILVFYCAHMEGKVSENTHLAASLIELLHTATLVHDDVVDDAHLRRGFFSINALWKNKVAVLVGDYLLSRGLLLSLKNKNYDILQIVSEAVEQISEGELLQIEKARKISVNEGVYFDVIRKKTASLFAACCAGGASSAGADEKRTNAYWKLGEKLGLVFQIRDDLFDFKPENAGKAAATDLKETKITLPLIYALDNAPKSERLRAIALVKRIKKKPANFDQILQFVHEFKGFKQAQEKMLELRDECFTMLKKLSLDSVRSTQFESLINYVIERKK